MAQDTERRRPVPEILGNYNHLNLKTYWKRGRGDKAEGRVRDDSEVSGLGNSED